MLSHKHLIFKISLFALGFIAMSAQILFIREALAIFNGNELVIGICLGGWMLLTAAGAFAGSFFRMPGTGVRGNKDQFFSTAIILLFLLLIALALLMPWALAYLKSRLLPAGVMAGVGHIVPILVVTLAPFCLISGMLFPILAGKLSDLKGKDLVYQAYALDSAGSILGGIVFSLIIFILPQSSTFNLQSFISRVLYPGQEVIESRHTPFGKLTLTKLGDQYNLYENGTPVSLGGDAIWREESVHYAMLLHPGPERVLMISGGIGGAIGEAFKYPGVNVDYIEINPWMTDLVDRYSPYPKIDRLRIISKDPRLFLNHSENHYDVILLNTPDPGSAELNRFYTQEFFCLLKERLNEGGIVSMSIPAAGNYMNEPSQLLHSVVFNTLSAVFKEIRIIPGSRDYYLATDGELNPSLWQNYYNYGFSNEYVNPGYILEELINDRSDLILKNLIPGVKTNSDLHPYIYVQTLRLWADQFKLDYRFIPAAMALLLVLAFILLGPVNLGLFAGGFTSASLEFILILWFQVIYGTVYQVTGLIFAAFMAGMVMGAMWPQRIFKTFTLIEFMKIQAGFILLALFLGILMPNVPYSLSPWLKFSMICGLVILTGFIMGALFALSGKLSKDRIIRASGRAFSSDLLGAAAGSILVAVYVIPQMGLPQTSLVLAVMNLMVLGLIYLKRKTIRSG